MERLASVDRLLFVVRDPSDLREGGSSPDLLASDGTDRAVCLVRDGDTSGLSHLPLQQRMTVELRALLGPAAESIATFVVSGHADDDVDGCAAAWGATRIVDLRGSAGRE